jgi:hypothetical protein
MSKAVTILFLCITCIYSNSQQITFSKALDLNGGFEYPISLIIENDGYLVTGTGQDFPNNGGWIGFTIIKADTFGNILWKNFYGQSGTNFYGAANYSFIKCKDYGYVVAATVFDAISSSYKACLIRFDDNGDTVFVKIFGKQFDDYGFSVVQTKENGFALLGESRTSSTNPFSGRFYLVVTDSSGNLLWDKLYFTTSARGVRIRSVDNDFILGGFGPESGYGLDAYLIRVDSIGNEKWKWNYGTQGDDCGANLSIKSNQDYIVTTCLDTVLNTSNPKSVYSIMHLDTARNIKWQKIFDIPEEHVVLKVIELKNKKEYVGSGAIYSPQWNNNNTSMGWLFKLDSVGNTIWERRYYYNNITFGYILTSFFVDVSETDDGGFILLGRCAELEQDLWLVKLDSNGCMGNYCGLTDTNCYYLPYPNCDDTLSVINTKHNKQNSISVFPNPANALINFLTNNEIEAIEKVTVFDISGKILHTENCLPVAANCTIDIKELSKGIYFYHAQLKDGSVARGKFVKE